MKLWFRPSGGSSRPPAVAEFIDPDWGDEGGMPGLGGRRAGDAGFRGKKRDAGLGGRRGMPV